MGNMLKRNQAGMQMAPQQGGMYAPYELFKNDVICKEKGTFQLF